MRVEMSTEDISLVVWVVLLLTTTVLGGAR
jgi:hypothetical protein